MSLPDEASSALAQIAGATPPNAAAISIVDCGIGNILSVQRMFEAVDVSAEIVSDPQALAGCRRLVLPGVGAFDAGMRALHDGNWVSELNRVVLGEGVPMLGICLGMQLLCRRSEEGEAAGLGWIEADVVQLDAGQSLKIPHMGWTVTDAARENPLIPRDEGEQRFYYVHKYRAVCDHPEDTLASASYGVPFTAAVHRANIYGVQFHPEKSHRFGMALMRRFAKLPCSTIG